MKFYRQGDVGIRQVRSIPAEATVVDTKGEPIILAYGEVTGHKHQIADIESVAILQTEDGRRFLKVTDSAGLVHEEHARIELPPGNYEVIQQREYSPEAIRNVAD